MQTLQARSQKSKARVNTGNGNVGANAKPRRRTKPIAAEARAPQPAAEIDTPARAERVAQAAYFLAEKRGFAPGFEWEDWFRAEAEVLQSPAEN